MSLTPEQIGELTSLNSDWPVGSIVRRTTYRGTSFGRDLRVVSASNRNRINNGQGCIGSAYISEGGGRYIVVQSTIGSDAVQPSRLSMINRGTLPDVATSEATPTATVADGSPDATALKAKYLEGWNDALDYIVDKSVDLSPPAAFLEKRGLN